MNGKITQTEFKKWGKQLLEIYTEITSPVRGLQFSSQADREQLMKMGVIVGGYTGDGVIQAVFIGLVNLSIKLKTDVPLKEFDNQTIEEWGKNVTKRIKEHCVANGYYKTDSPADLTQIKERGQKIIKILLDEEEFLKYIIYSDREERKILVDTAVFFRELKKIVSPIMFEEDDVNILPNITYFYEDAIGRVEKLISKKEQVEKDNKPGKNNPTSSAPNSPKLSSEYKKNLEAEIERLRNQVKELESKTNDNTDNDIQKETYRKMLDNVKKSLNDKEKEKDKLKDSEKSSTSSPNNNQLNWAIGLGIGALVVGLLCLILLVSKRKD